MYKGFETYWKTKKLTECSLSKSKTFAPEVDKKMNEKHLLKQNYKNQTVVH